MPAIFFFGGGGGTRNVGGLLDVKGKNIIGPFSIKPAEMWSENRTNPKEAKWKANSYFFNDNRMR